MANPFIRNSDNKVAMGVQHGDITAVLSGVNVYDGTNNPSCDKCGVVLSTPLSATCVLSFVGKFGFAQLCRFVGTVVVSGYTLQFKLDGTVLIIEIIAGGGCSGLGGQLFAGDTAGACNPWDATTANLTHPGPTCSVGGNIGWGGTCTLTYCH